MNKEILLNFIASLANSGLIVIHDKKLKQIEIKAEKFIKSQPNGEASRVSTNEHTKEVNNCLNCGSELPEGKKFCNSFCEYQYIYY